MKILLSKFYNKNRVEVASLQLKADARHKVEAAFLIPQSETLEDLRANKCYMSPFLGSAPPTEFLVNFTPTFSSSVISKGHPFRAVHLSFIVSPDQLQTTSVLSESQVLANASLYPRSSCRTGQVNKLATKLINSYAKTGDIASAGLVFDTICRLDAFLNDVMMKGFVWNGCFEDAISVC
ncbi:hypothetical protein EJ110_NYTH22172 [Nymphaea thermarum]|nr:hypothetical protein EJ110_NYTH22172 [Nymphaea thermarum]